MNSFNVFCNCCRLRLLSGVSAAPAPVPVIEVVNVLSSERRSETPQARPVKQKRLRPKAAPQLSSTQDNDGVAALSGEGAIQANPPSAQAATGDPQSGETQSDGEILSPLPHDHAGALISAPLPRSPATTFFEIISSNAPIETTAPVAVAAAVAAASDADIVVAEIAAVGEPSMEPQPSEVEVSPSIFHTDIARTAPMRRPPAPTPQSPPRPRSVHSRPENHGRHLRSAIDDARTLAGLPPRSPRKFIDKSA
jgi:hypothetical protein